MTITIQLTEVPINETVTTRVHTLPNIGGDFGTNFDCFIQLPDRTGKVAPVHGRFTVHHQRMCIEALNGNKIKLNGLAIASGRVTPIDDGSMLEVSDYVMLVSITGQDEIEEPTVETVNQVETKSPFSPSSLEMNDEDDDNVLMKNNTDDIQQQSFEEESMINTPHFSANGVFSDDPFDDDPFKDEEISLKDEPLDEDSTTSNSGNTIVLDEPATADVESEPLEFNNQRYPANNQVVNNEKSQENIEQLINLLDRQLVSQNDQQAQLFMALEKTLSTFLEEFSPQHLSEEFSDFGKPFFVNQEQQFWRLYRKSYNRRMKKGDYTRLFKALLLENLQAGEGS